MTSAIGTIEHTGFIADRYTTLRTEGAVIYVNAGRPTAFTETPSIERWETFWQTVDALGVWRWAPEYGWGVKDGGPWQLRLTHGRESIAVTGNGDAEYAAPGFRRLCLAWDDLMAGALLAPKARQRLRCEFELCVSVPAAEMLWTAQTDRLPIRRALDEALTGVEMTSYQFTPGRAGWLWIAEDANVLRQAAITVLERTDVENPEAALRSYTSGAIERIWPR